MTETASGGIRLKRYLPILLIVACPPSVMLLWHAMVHQGGSLLLLAREIAVLGIFSLIADLWLPVFFGTKEAWAVIASFAALELILMRIVPGKEYTGPVTPKGNVPRYRNNGLACFIITLVLFAACSFRLELFPATIIYDRFGEILGALNFTSLVVCLFLYIKGRFRPSTTDSGITGNFIFDYYWGTELYPRVLGWDLKMFTNCRFGMMGWGLIIISFAAKQHQLHGLSDSMAVAVALQLVYITKFFIWEPGYMSSMDIMHDRAGFYICWGCLVWLPCVYTSHTLYLVDHPNRLGTVPALAVFLLGAAAIMTNYWADRQRQRVRATGGACTVWGKPPVVIRAKYRTTQDEEKESLLLASGWWGLSRHFHYIPELAAAFLWTVPALFENFLPYFYVTFLCVLLIHRSVRDDRRCADKYGPYWDRYRKLVPNRIIPSFRRRKEA